VLHKLILSGGHWLPFARSRIKALLAAGLSHAAQRFNMPDGVNVAVRIVGDNHFIHISGGSCVLAMDSGVVDVLSIGELNPNTYLPGVLYEAGPALSYNARFVADPKNPPERIKVLPPKDSTGQFSGTLNYDRKFFTGRIFDGAASFAPGKIDAVPPTDPPTWVPNPLDTNLWIKKRGAVLCPASIFTGKCRLYVQAMYGLPLYTYNAGGRQIGTTPPLVVVSDTSAAPALWLPAYVAKNDFAVVDGVNVPTVYPDILLDTNCGVWLDPETGKHWLFKPSIDGQLRVYPLVSNTCGELLRKFLVTVGLLVPTGPLNEEDREHLETYILAYSKPDAKHKQLATGGAITAYSMSYGWHWNWAGDTADAVVNGSFMQDATNSAMRSTHYRLGVSKLPLPVPAAGFGPDAPAQEWTSTTTTVEGPVDWAVYRALWTLAEPNYADFVLSKTTPKSSSVFACNAPFYAFYKKNALQVCRVGVTTIAGSPASVVYVNATASHAGNGGDQNPVTVGMTNGSITKINAVASHFSARIYVGDYSSLASPYGSVYVSPSTVKVEGKTKNSWFAGYGAGNNGTRDFWVTDDFGGGGHYVNETSTILDDRQTLGVTFTTTVTSETITKWGLMAVVVPFYDAEAVYVRSILREDKTTSFRSTYNLNKIYSGPIGAFLVRTTTNVTPAGHQYAQGIGSFPSDYHNLVSQVIDYPPGTQIVVAQEERLVCGAGVIPATFGATSGLAEMHSNALDTVSALYSTLSSTPRMPVVYAPGFITQVNMTANPTSPAIVGWV